MMEKSRIEDHKETNSLLEKKEFSWFKEIGLLFVDSFSTLVSLVAGISIGDANLYFIGRLGRYEYTAAAGTATVLYNALAFAPTICMSFGLGNIGSQFVGAGKLREFGLMLHGAVIFNIFLSLFGYTLLLILSRLLIYSNLGEFTITQIVNYVSFLILAILAVGIATPVRQVLVSQQYFSFQTAINLPACLLHVLWSWLFTFPFELGFIGSPLAIGLTETIIGLFLVIYIWIYHRDNKVWVPWSMESFRIIPKYVQKVIPMAITMYAEWIAFEILTFICSFLGEFQMAAFTAYINTLVTFYMVPLALSMTFGTKIGNACLLYTSPSPRDS
eukprot:TRINITY_DN15824_c0_g1_i1.p1 TRINITY_DN15824_c0_g1~~TRINITY_DN15824_c0_g1_i1.p1  ORF type:complete len:330 (-),score=19.39 TRINITY_DN15824_c0_g1_i1:41-1030(-)